MSRIRLQDQDSHEDAPFLDDHPDEPIPEPLSSSQPRPLRPRRPWQTSNPKTVIILLSVVKFVIVLSGMLMLMPMYRLLEDAFCHAHFQDDSPGLMDEMKCKVEEVQSGLAFLMGWFGLLNSLLRKRPILIRMRLMLTRLDLIATYPYGLLADRIGRKPTLMLSYGGMAFSFCLSPLMLGSWKYAMRENPYMMLGGSVMTLVGGGIPVLMATLYAMAADVSSEETKCVLLKTAEFDLADTNRATNFLYLTMGASGGSLLGPLVAGLLMERFDPWVPIAVVLSTIPIVFAMFVFIPETLTINVKTQHAENVTLREHIGRGIKDLLQSLRMLKNKNIPLCLVTFFFAQVRFAAGSSTLAQYISKNFGWTLAETSILLSPLGIVGIMVLASLPKVSELMTSRLGYTSFGKDLYLAKVSMLILTVSAFIRAFSPSIGLFLVGLFISAFGGAESALVRATMSTFVEPSYTSRLFALAGTVEVLGSFAAGPVMAWFFDRGMRWGGLWTGLPWFYLGVTCALAWLALVLVRAPRKSWDGEGIFGEEEGGDSRPSNPVRLD